MKIFNKIILASLLGLILVACSSPEDKKAEEISGFKIGELKKAIKLSREFDKLQENIPGSMDEAMRIGKKIQELRKEIHEYSDQLHGIQKILRTDPEVYKEVFGEDKDYRQVLIAKLQDKLKESAKQDPQMQQIVKDIKDFTNSLDKTKLRDYDYKSSMRKEYDLKIKELKKRYNELVEEFIEKHKKLNLTKDEKNTLEDKSCLFSCPPMNLFEIGFPIY
ncbi:hypothetical protein [Helicobacter sp. 13S00477-4]|uniref:hypothetical protein n=1 Tax=Helicobacter sp. 13S00477-4 TaxID=1905759 RepID=UPI000BA7486B|nr:hypothetical protein [Helicobacter sp. 13S00477-4]PAF50482.1 hypothetical protein BKH44_08200 [Helicobacter sp. 13S00477-4]